MCFNRSKPTIRIFGVRVKIQLLLLIGIRFQLDFYSDPKYWLRFHLDFYSDPKYFYSDPICFPLTTQAHQYVFGRSRRIERR